TPCSARTIAASNANPRGGAVIVGIDAADLYRKANNTNARNAMSFKTVVTFCVKLPQRTPRHRSSANKSTIVSATAVCLGARTGNRTPKYSATTIEISAFVALLDIQSLQPTTNPA